MRKKIIFYIGSMQRGGAQRVMTNLLTLFLDAGNEVLLVNDIVPSGVVPEYSIDSRVRRLFLGGSKDNVFEKNIKRLLRLRAILRQEKPDVAVSFMGPQNIRLLLASIGSKAKTVVSVRNDPNEEYGRGLKKILANMVFFCADGIVFQTGDAKRYFSKSNQLKSRIIFNPVNKIFYDTPWNPSRKEIVVVGRLEKQKNPFLAIDAFLNIADDYPDYKLVFYGDGSLKKVLAEYIAKRNAEKKIELRGATDDVARVLSESALYMMTSDFEGMPNALMEAMAVGIPAISTNCPCGGPASLIDSPSKGFLVPVGNSKELSDKLRVLLDNEDLRNTITHAAQKRALEFRSEVVIKHWNDYINEVVKG